MKCCSKFWQFNHLNGGICCRMCYNHRFCSSLSYHSGHWVKNFNVQFILRVHLYNQYKYNITYSFHSVPPIHRVVTQFHQVKAKFQKCCHAQHIQLQEHFLLAHFPCNKTQDSVHNQQCVLKFVR